MKKIKMKKILIALGIAGVTTIGNAQWAVTNVNDPIYYPAYFGPTGIFTQLMGQMNNSVKASVDQVATLSEISRKQAAQLQQDTDARNRAAMGQASIAAKNAAIFPTLQACAELTKRGIGSGASASAASGGSSGGSSGKTSVAAAAANIKTEISKQTLLLQAKNNLGTCSQVDASNKIAGCSGLGNFGGSINVASSDVSPLSIKGNTSNTDKTSKENQEVANYTINAQGIDVANQYIKNATLYNAPKMLPDNKLQANPGYKSLYDAVMIKINGAQQAMKDILALRKAPNELPAGSLAQKYWEANNDKYKTLFGMTPPKAPSVADIIAFNSTNDYMGVPDDTAEDELALLKSLDKKIALNNYIASKQMIQQENTNILLSLLLTQAVTPADLGALNTQYSKIMNSSAGSN